MCGEIDPHSLTREQWGPKQGDSTWPHLHGTQSSVKGTGSTSSTGVRKNVQLLWAEAE